MKIHNIFHISFLEPYTGTNEPNNPPPPPIEVEGKEKYKVKKILNNRIHYNKFQYLVKWMDYQHLDNQWPKDNIAGSQDLMSLFHNIYPNKLGEGNIKTNKNIYSSVYKGNTSSKAVES